MEQLSQINDKIALRHVSIELATRTLQYIHFYNNNIPYDINKHLYIAKAIENYINGDAELPEYTNVYKELLNNLKTDFKQPSFPNLKLKE